MCICQYLHNLMHIISALEKHIQPYEYENVWCHSKCGGTVYHDLKSHHLWIVNRNNSGKEPIFIFM